MKKIISLLLCLFLLLSIAVPVFAEGEYGSKAPLLIDEAEKLTEEEYDELLERMNTLSEGYKFDFCAVLVDGIASDDIMTYTDNYFLDHGYGQGTELDGCLLLVDFDSREYWLSTSGYGITAFTDYGINVIKDRFDDYLTDGDCYNAIMIYLDTAVDYVEEAKLGSPYDVIHEYPGYSAKEYGRGSGHNIVKGICISLLVALAVSAVVVFSIKKSYKAVQFQSAASNYLDNGSLAVTNQYDRFLYTTVSKRKRESSSSGGGSSTHSTSGHSFGGGGGKF